MASGPTPNYKETRGGPKSATRTQIPIKKKLMYCSGQRVTLRGPLQGNHCDDVSSGNANSAYLGHAG
eukprot:4661114-Pyramimonas_sp.AAC.1